jgi:outer membrane protein insertion porin family
MLGLLLMAAAAEASAEQYAGRMLVDVRVEVAGRPFSEPTVLELIETRVGEPLQMTKVRATIDHLVGLGRFEDVRAYASPSPEGVVLRWLLVPVRRIESISTSGDVGLGAKAVRTELADRFGALPPVTAVEEMTAALQTYYADRGYRNVTIKPDLAPTGTLDRANLVLNIAAGVRTTIAEATMRGTLLEPQAALVRRLGLEAGRPYDRPQIESRITAYEEELRSLGYYEARIRETHTFSTDGRLATITIDSDPGPHVRVVFEGDALPESERDALVPIREERSVDLDLLEDASRNIEAALRRQGYRAASAPYERALAGGEMVLTFTVRRGPLHRLNGVEVSGESGISRADIAPLLQLKPGEPFVEARSAAVQAAITELYRVRGYATATVTPAIQVLPAENRAGVEFRPVDVRFDIVEGPQTVMAKVAFSGTAAFQEPQLLASLGLLPGRPFYRPQLGVDRDSLEHLYRGSGYESVIVTPQLAFDADGRGATITWTIDEGLQVHIDRVLITGNDRTGANLIRREITLRPGAPISDEALIESQRKLAVLGLFRRVRITAVPRPGSNVRDVLIEIEEADPSSVTVGGGLEVTGIGRQSETGGGAEDQIDFAPRAFFDFTRRNLWGKNRSATVFGRVSLRKRSPSADNTDPTDTGGYGLNDYRAFFSFREPRAFGGGGDAQATAFVEQGIRTSFNFNRRGVSADYARRVQRFTITGRYTFDYTQLFDEQINAEDQLLIDRLFPQIKLSKFFGGVLRDTRDDVLDPHKGSVLGVDGSVAARKLGSQVGFVRTFLQGFVYRRLPGRGVVLAAGARLGVATGFKRAVPPVFEIAHRPGEAAPNQAIFATEVKDLPASERFFAGGDTTVRGFALDRLGTRETLDPQGFPQGGNGLAVFNLETRAPYWKQVQFVWFADAGNVFKNASDIQLNQLRVTSGIGFRYRSPIGPLRVDWGWKVSTRLLLTGGRERSNVLHISLGQAF